MSKPDTKVSFLCSIEKPKNSEKHGNSLQNQVLALRNGVPAQCIGLLRPLSGVRRMRFVGRRNRHSDPLPFVPARAQPHRAGVQRTGGSRHDVGLTFPKTSRKGPNPAPNAHFPKNFTIFDFVLDTPSRHNQADACFCARLSVSLTSS